MHMSPLCISTGVLKNIMDLANITGKYTMYPWSLQANLLMGGQCTLAINPWRPYRSAWFYLTACWTDASICMDKHWSQLAQAEAGKNVFWPRDLDLWPMTLIFKVNPGSFKVDPWTKFREPRAIGFAFTALKPLSVGALKQKIKNKK